MNTIILDNTLIDPETSVPYCTWSNLSALGGETLFKNGDLFYLEKSDKKSSYVLLNIEYQHMNVSEIQKWLDGKEITVHVDETSFTQDLHLTRPMKLVSDDTSTPPDDDGGFDFGGGEDNHGSVTLEITA